jgi:putative membrane protein
MNMKWSKQWAAALLVAPTMYLASCGGSSNNNETTDTLSTQSAPPVGAESPAKATDTLTTVGEGGNSSASGNTDQSTTSPGNVAATGASSSGGSEAKKSTASTSKKHRSTKKSNVSSADNTKPESKIADTSVAVEKTNMNSVTRKQDDADSSTMSKSIMDTSSSVTKVDTTGEDMRNMDSTRADSSWNKSSNVGIPSTPDSTKSTMVKDSTSPVVTDTTMQDKTADNSAGMNFTPSSFITTQIQNNYGEIKMARLAIDQASSSEVKSLAKILENDHNQALRDLQDLAKDQTDLAGTLPTKESDSAREHITMMQNNRGSDFDKIWVSHMYQMHVRSVQTYELAQNQISDEELKAWISKILPKLKEHRDKLEQLDRNLNK